jgi:hypothetical protein
MHIWFFTGASPFPTLICRSGLEFRRGLAEKTERGVIRSNIQVATERHNSNSRCRIGKGPAVSYWDRVPPALGVAVEGCAPAGLVAGLAVGFAAGFTAGFGTGGLASVASMF